MTDNKPWYLSKTIWAALISIIATVAAFFGVTIDDSLRESLSVGLLQLVTAIAGIVAIFGRISASAKIS
ncbi:hypothetical protein [Ahrensia marina]|uniref:hypothetical protein n=1 Tax=Ahrensia marina TaxID=1514904 RepID=UPI0009EC46A0|nr:hypothetical protein [Ahrensia marina]